MKAHTVACPGILLSGIGVADPAAGNPDGLAGVVFAGGRIVEAEGDGVLLLFLDHAGTEGGSWLLRAAHPDVYWDEMVAAEFLPDLGDRRAAVKRIRARHPHLPPEGWTALASGDDPFHQGGHWELGILSEGHAVEVRRWPVPADLPLVISVECRGGEAKACKPAALAADRAAVRMARVAKAAREGKRVPR